MRQPETSEGLRAGRGEIKSLNGIRGICALCVVFGHYDLAKMSPVFAVFEWHNAAVDIFFCLSGFTMFYVHGREAGPLDFPDFILKRVARVWPLCVATMVLALLSYVHHMAQLGYHFGALKILTDLIRQILMVNCWLFVGNGIQYNVPQWSISIEFFLYLVIFPLLYLVSDSVRKLPTGLLATMIFVLMAGSVVMYDAFFDPNNPELGLRTPVLVSMMARGWFGFAAGFLLYIFSLNFGPLARLGRFCDVVCLIVVAITILSAFGIVEAQIIIMFAPLVIVTSLDSDSVASRFLSSRPVNYIGLLSYSIYLIHVPLLWYCMLFTRHVLVPLFKLGDPAVANTIVSLVVLAPLSILSYHYFERPARKWLYRLGKSGLAIRAPSTSY